MKKEKKIYEAPTMTEVHVRTQSIICASGQQSGGDEGDGARSFDFSDDDE